MPLISTLLTKLSSFTNLTPLAAQAPSISNAMSKVGMYQPAIAGAAGIISRTLTKDDSAYGTKQTDLSDWNDLSDWSHWAHFSLFVTPATIVACSVAGGITHQDGELYIVSSIGIS